jgi:hypothetical protein
MDTAPQPCFSLRTAAIDAGVLRLSDLVAWADREILRLDAPPMWLLDLSLATDARGLDVAWQRAIDGDEAGPVELLSLDPTELRLGLLYLEYDAGRLTLAELLERAGLETDPPTAGLGLDCEAFWALLNELEGRAPRPRDAPPLEARVRKLLGMAAETARAALPYLRSLCG